jgi:hypothetical protein
MLKLSLLTFAKKKKTVIAQILTAKDQEKWKCLALLMVWWRVRNKCNAGESTASAVSVCHQVISLAAEFEHFF